MMSHWLITKKAMAQNCTMAQKLRNQPNKNQTGSAIQQHKY